MVSKASGTQPPPGGRTKRRAPQAEVGRDANERADTISSAHAHRVPPGSSRTPTGAGASGRASTMDAGAAATLPSASSTSLSAVASSSSLRPAPSGSRTMAPLSQGARETTSRGHRGRASQGGVGRAGPQPHPAGHHTVSGASMGTASYPPARRQNGAVTSSNLHVEVHEEHVHRRDPPTRDKQQPPRHSHQHHHSLHHLDQAVPTGNHPTQAGGPPDTPQEAPHKHAGNQPRHSRHAHTAPRQSSSLSSAAGGQSGASSSTPKQGSPVKTRKVPQDTHHRHQQQQQQYRQSRTLPGHSTGAGGGPSSMVSNSNPARSRESVQRSASSGRERQPQGGGVTYPSRTEGATAQAAGHVSTRVVSSPAREVVAPSKQSKDSKDRYIRQTQSKQAAATLPAQRGRTEGGAAGGGRSGQATATMYYQRGKTPAAAAAADQASRPMGSTSQESTSNGRQLVSSISHGRPLNPTVTVHVPSQEPGRRDRDIARITVDAREIVNPKRATTASGAALGGPDGGRMRTAVNTQGHIGASSGQSPSRQVVPAPSSRPTGMGGTSDDNAGSVDPNSLHLDIVNVESTEGRVHSAHSRPGPQPPPTSSAASREANRIFTNHLAAGVSHGRPERPETTEALPDILNSHMLPPYTVRQNQHRASRPSAQHRAAATGSSGTSSVQASRARQQRGRRRGGPRDRRSGGGGTSGMTQLDDEEKGCCSRESCLRCVTTITTFRWVLVSLALLGVMCVVTGIVLGALHMTVSSSFLTLSLMFIGLGIMLVIVVGVGWKCTPTGHEPCHLLFNLGEHCTRDVNVTSRRRHRDRNHWYGGVTYPEFRYRRPPPSYNASMQEYQQHLMLAQLQLNNDAPAGAAQNQNDPNAAVVLPPGVSDDDYSLPSSPPPSYKSRASTIRPGLHITFPPQSGSYPSSHPPTYRSTDSGTDRPSLNLEEDADDDRQAVVGLPAAGHVGGVDNPACSDGETVAVGGGATSGSTSRGASRSSSRSGSEERQVVGATSLPPAGPATLHRANQVVGYLDNVLENHDRTLDHSGNLADGGAKTAALTDAQASSSSSSAAAAQGGPSASADSSLKSGTSLTSVKTTSSTEETNRIRDTQL